MTGLDALADGVYFLLGHNLIEFDLPYLRAATPHLRLLRLTVIDTLRLSPLASPSNPYHRLAAILERRLAHSGVSLDDAGDRVCCFSPRSQPRGADSITFATRTLEFR